MVKLGTLAAIGEGLESAARSGSQVYLQQKLLKDLLEEELIQKKAEEEELLEDLSALQGSSTKDPIQQVVDWGEKKLGDLTGIQTENYENLTKEAISKDKLVEIYRKKHKLPSDKKTRKDIENHLKSMGQKELFNEFGITLDANRQDTVKKLLEENKGKTKAAFKEKHPIIHSFKELLTKDWGKSQKYKDIGATIAKTPGRFAKMGMSLISGLDEKMQKSRDKQGLTRLSPSLREELTPSIEAIESGDRSIDEFFGANPNSNANLATEILTDIALPLPGPKISKGKGAIPKNIAKGAVAGGAYGALYGEGNPKSIMHGMTIGGALHPAIGMIPSKTQRLQKELKNSKSRAAITDKEEILNRADILGEEALIPEIVGDEKLINRLKRDSSKTNKDRMEQMQTNIRDYAKTVSEPLPKGKDIELYETLEKMASDAKEKSSQLYDITKESGIGKYGVLEKSFLEQWLKIVKEHEPHISGLPSLKGAKRGVTANKVEKTLLGSPVEQKFYRQFAIGNKETIPTPADFLKFRSTIRKRLEGAEGGPLKEELSYLMDDLNKLVKSADPESNLARASSNYATEVAPFSEKSIKKARDSVRFENRKQGRPQVSDIFKHGEEVAQVFEKLATQQKLNILGSILENIIQIEKKTPERAVEKLWTKISKDMPYMLETSDVQFRKILKQIENAKEVGDILSSLQRTSTADIGSRQAAAKTAELLRTILYGSSVLSGNFRTAATVGLGHTASKGVTKARNAAFRKRMGQNNLKYYLKPELLDEVIKNKKFKHRHRLPIAILNEDPQRGEENMIE